jgi:hypothetical protein
MGPFQGESGGMNQSEAGGPSFLFLSRNGSIGQGKE